MISSPLFPMSSRRPLAIIQNYASALENDGLDDETRHEYLETPRTASGNLAERVTNILRHWRGGMGRLQKRGLPLSRLFDMYAFYKTIIAVQGMVQHRKYHRHALPAALVSMPALETAVLEQGDKS